MTSRSRFVVLGCAWFVAGVGAGCHPVVTDPCEGVSCSGFGTCEEQAGNPSCNCQEGYLAEGLACVIDPCFGVTCSGQGTCEEESGNPSCVCEVGYLPEGLACVPGIINGDFSQGLTPWSVTNVSEEIEACSNAFAGGNIINRSLVLNAHSAYGIAQASQSFEPVRPIRLRASYELMGTCSSLSIGFLREDEQVFLFQRSTDRIGGADSVAWIAGEINGTDATCLFQSSPPREIDFHCYNIPDESSIPCREEACQLVPRAATLEVLFDWIEATVTVMVGETTVGSYHLLEPDTYTVDGVFLEVKHACCDGRMDTEATFDDLSLEAESL